MPINTPGLLQPMIQPQQQPATSIPGQRGRPPSTGPSSSTAQTNPQTVNMGGMGTGLPIPISSQVQQQVQPKGFGNTPTHATGQTAKTAARKGLKLMHTTKKSNADMSYGTTASNKTVSTGTNMTGKGIGQSGLSSSGMPQFGMGYQSAPISPTTPAFNPIPSKLPATMNMGGIKQPRMQSQMVDLGSQSAVIAGGGMMKDPRAPKMAAYLGYLAANHRVQLNSEDNNPSPQR